jgi:hypothetical protein
VGVRKETGQVLGGKVGASTKGASPSKILVEGRHVQIIQVLLGGREPRDVEL